jgi:hypothetical protein
MYVAPKQGVLIICAMRVILNQVLLDHHQVRQSNLRVVCPRDDIVQVDVFMIRVPQDQVEPDVCRESEDGYPCMRRVSL